MTSKSLDKHGRSLGARYNGGKAGVKPKMQYLEKPFVIQQVGYGQSTDTESKPLTVEERLAKQRQENIKQAYAEDSTTKAKEETKTVAFSLGWMQCPVTQSKQTLLDNLFTAKTTSDQKSLVVKSNAHLNDPVRQGEIVIIPTTEPTTDKETQALNDLIEDAQAASTELAKLTDEQVATVNRHFELLDYYASSIVDRVRNDGIPSDYYAYASTGVGAVAGAVEQHLNNINGVLTEINSTYIEQVAMASRTGGINYGEFVSQRAALFKKLDGTFARLSKKSIRLSVYQQIRRALNLSTKSVIHNASEIIEDGVVPNLGKRMANISIGIKAAKGVGYVGLALGAASGVNNIYDACSVDGTGECGKTTTREVTGFFGGFYGGIVGGDVALAGTLLLLGVVGVTSAPVIAIGSIGAVVVGGAIGGVTGATTGKALGDTAYSLYEWFGSVVDEVF